MPQSLTLWIGPRRLIARESRASERQGRRRGAPAPGIPAVRRRTRMPQVWLLSARHLHRGCALSPSSASDAKRTSGPRQRRGKMRRREICSRFELGLSSATREARWLRQLLRPLSLFSGSTHIPVACLLQRSPRDRDQRPSFGSGQTAVLPFSTSLPKTKRHGTDDPIRTTCLAFQDPRVIEQGCGRTAKARIDPPRWRQSGEVQRLDRGSCFCTNI